jgi:hypothetical protein
MAATTAKIQAMRREGPILIAKMKAPGATRALLGWQETIS